MTRTTILTALLTLSACGGSGLVESDLLEGADDTVSLSNELSTSVPVGSTLQATASVNLRSGAGTGYKVLLVVPSGGKVVTVDLKTPTNGFYKVKYNGTVGYSHGNYYKLVSSPPVVNTARETAITRAKAGVGFSYWWGHGRFLASGSTSSNKGSCSGDCPSCSHSGSYGGDCSGLAAKAWSLGSTDLAVDSHPYSTYNFANQTTAWKVVSRGSLGKGDALVYNQNGAGHIVIYESGDGWGSFWAYECKGCAAGCVKNLRTAGTEYKGISSNRF